MAQEAQPNGAPAATSREFRALDEASLAAYIETHPALAARLGGASADWSVKEVGDGNINFVYIVVGPTGSLVLKQVGLRICDIDPSTGQCHLGFFTSRPKQSFWPCFWIPFVDGRGEPRSEAMSASGH
jgi:hypothetical protein